MGGSSSTAALTLHDVVRAREGLLIELQSRWCVEQARNQQDGSMSMQSRLLQAFQHFDSVRLIATA